MAPLDGLRSKRLASVPTPKPLPDEAFFCSVCRSDFFLPRLKLFDAFF